MAIHKGRTEDAEAPILGACWWVAGKKIVGRVVRSFETRNGECYQLQLPEKVAFLGEQVDRVSVGALKGFQMALAAAGLADLQVDDTVLIECTGKTETQKGNAMVNFYVEVNRAE